MNFNDLFHQDGSFLSPFVFGLKNYIEMPMEKQSVSSGLYIWQLKGILS